MASHIRERRKVDKIIYITINTMAEANQRWINNSQKNDPEDYYNFQMIIDN